VEGENLQPGFADRVDQARPSSSSARARAAPPPETPALGGQLGFTNLLVDDRIPTSAPNARRLSGAAQQRPTPGAGFYALPLSRYSSASLPQWRNLPLRTIHDQIMVGLERNPELGSGVEGLSQKPSGFRRNTSLATDDLVDPLYWHPQVIGKGNLGKS
jgi:hypothetical protein